MIARSGRRAVALAALTLASAWPAFAQTNAQLEFRNGMAAYQKNDDIDAARAAFGRAIALDKTFTAPVFNLAQLEEAQERWGEAAKWYKAYLTLDKTSPYADIAEKKLLLLAGYIEADKTVEGKKRRIYTQYLHQAQTYLAGGKVGAAAAYAELATSLEPQRFEAYVMHALALIDGERYADALVKLDSAMLLAIGPEKTDIAALVARCRDAMAQQSKISAADKLFQQRSYPAAAAAYADIWIVLDRPEFGFLAAKSWALAKQETSAVKIYDRLAAAKAVDVASRARREKADLLAAQQALATPANLVAPKPAEALPPEFLRAAQLIEAKNFYEADAKLTVILDGVLPGPDYARMFDARAVARLGMNEYLAAINDSSTAVVLNPRLQEAWLHRSQGHAALGNYAEAVRDLDRAIELSTDVTTKDRLRASKKLYQSKLEQPT